MLNPIAGLIPPVGALSQEERIENVNSVFKVMHGFYGSLFLSKYATGEVDKAGHDAGIISARQIWAHGLRDFDLSTVKAALAKCLTDHPEFPPSLPQFVTMCRAAEPRKAYRAGPPAIGMSQQLVSQYARQAREITRKHDEASRTNWAGIRKIPTGLGGLKLAIADAVGAAGGDEAAELRRLDSMFTRSPA